MLPARNRLNLSLEDAKNRPPGKKLSSQELILVFRQGSPVFKAAVTVSKKVAAKAVERNRIKRLITHALKAKQNLKGEWFVIVKKNIAHLKMSEVSSKLDKLFAKLAR